MEQEFQLHWQGGKHFVLTNALVLQEKKKNINFQTKNPRHWVHDAKLKHWVLPNNLAGRSLETRPEAKALGAA